MRLFRGLRQAGIREAIKDSGGRGAVGFSEARARVAGRLLDARPVVYPYLGSRLILLAIGLLTQILIQPYAAKSNTLRLGGDHAWLNLWGAWDSGWYVTLAQAGYQERPYPEGWVNWVFFPAYPFLSAGIAKLTHLPVFVVMLIVSNACFLAALFLIRRLARAEFDPRTADLAVALICAVPGSYIFSSAYTESLFLLALSASLLLLREGRWMAGGAAAAVAVLTRNLGLGLLLPFAVWAAPRLWTLARQAAAGAPDAWRRFTGEAARVAAGGALPLLALAGFAGYLYQKSGDPLAFVHGQAGWGRAVGNPLRGPIIFLLAPQAMADNNNLVSVAFVYLSLALAAALFLMRRWALFALAVFMTLVPLSTGIFSYQRYCMVMLPLFLAAAKLLEPRPAAAATSLIVLSALNGFMMVAWTLMLGSTA
jgi:hypothetical protein